MKILPLFIAVLLLLIPSVPLMAQDAPEWTCDGGDNDVLNAAIAADEAGDLANALELATIAEDICLDNFIRWQQATGLRQRLEILTAEPDASADVFETATELNQQAVMATAAGRYDEAITLFEQTLELVREIDDRASEGVVLSSIGEVYRLQGAYDQALIYYQQAVDVFRDENLQAEQTAVELGIARLYLDQNADVEALNVVTPIREAAAASGDAQTEYDALIIETIALAGTGRYLRVPDNLARLEALSLQLGNEAPETIEALRLVQEVLGDAPDDEAEWEARLALAQGNPELEITILLAESSWHAEAQRYDAALDAASTARDIARQNRLTLSEAQMTLALGRIYTSAGRLPEALDAFQTARSIASAEAFPTFVMTAYALESELYYTAGQFERSATLFEAALEIAIATGNEEYQAYFLNLLGTVYLDIDLEQSAAYLEQAQQIVLDAELTSIDNLDVELGITGTLIDTLNAVEAGDLQRAQELLDMVTPSLQTTEGIAGAYYTAAATGALAEFSLELDEARTAYEQSLEILLSQPPALAVNNQILNSEDVLQSATPGRGLARVLLRQGDVAGAFTAIEQERVFLDTGLLLSSDFDLSAIDDDTLLQTEAELRAALQVAQTELDTAVAGNDAFAIQQADTTLRDARVAYQQHLERMRTTDSYRAREFSHDVATLDEVRAALPADTTLIVYVIDDAISPLPASYALLLTRDRLQSVPLRGVELESIDALVTAFATDRRLTTPLRDLYDAVFAPLESQITTENLIIVPDRSLRYVPFVALQRPDDSYLLDTYTISYVPTATTLSQLSARERVQASGSPLVVAQSAAPGLPDLRFASQEASQIADALSVAPIISATETQFRAAASGSPVITISAHAELDPDTPLFSTIHLGGDETNDGRLDVYEIYTLDLTTATGLVVLSGCETGSGQGDDFGLLNRAFLSAGAAQVVASLWTVDDEATATLISRFMALRSDTTDAEALRLAMLETRMSFADPYFWASFTLSGAENINTPAPVDTPLDIIPGGDVLVIAGIAALEAGNFEAAIELYTQALETGWIDADTYNRRGVAYVEMGDYAQALPDFNAAIERNDTFAQAYVNRGVAYYNLGEYELAIEDYTTGLADDPDNALTHSRRGTAYFELGNFDAAITDYTAALELDNTVFWYPYNRGLAYYETGRYTAAIADFTTAIAVDDTYTLAFRYRGDSYAMLGDNAAADADYTRLIDLLPDDPGALQVRGMWRFIAGDVVHAQQDFEAAIELAPEQFIYYYWAGLSAVGNGDLTLAQSYLDRAAELLGENPGLQAYITLWSGVQARAAGDETQADELFAQAQAFNDVADNDEGTRRRFEALLSLVTGDAEQAAILYAEIRANNPLPHQGFTTSLYFAVLEATFPDDATIATQAEEWRNRSAAVNE